MHLLRIEKSDANIVVPGLILVDPPIADNYLSVMKSKREPAPATTFHLESKLFLGGYEDFINPAFIHIEEKASPRSLSRHGLLEDLMYYWDLEEPKNFDPDTPTLLSLSYYPLKIIAAEWVNYLAVMNCHIKKYEYTIESLSAPLGGLEKLDSDLRSLQSWRRRSLASHQKISAVKYFIQLQTQKVRACTSEDSLSLLDDFTHIEKSLKGYSKRLENMLPVVTSLVQIIDSRRSMVETANVSRLTFLAFIFVPLSFTSSLFSMNSDVGPGGRYFWIYFVVSVPLTAVVFLLARPPSIVLSWLHNHTRGHGLATSPV